MIEMTMYTHAAGYALHVCEEDARRGDQAFYFSWRLSSAETGSAHPVRKTSCRV